MSPLSAIWNEVLNCERCLHDPEIGGQLRDLPFFLPLPSNVEEPSHTYLFVAMEPSGNWLKTGAEGRRKVSGGYVNFALTLNDYKLVFAVQKCMFCEGEGFDITDSMELFRFFDPQTHAHLLETSSQGIRNMSTFNDTTSRRKC